MIRIRIATNRICISTLKIDENSSKTGPTPDGTETTLWGAEELLLHCRHSSATTAFTAIGTCKFSKREPRMVATRKHTCARALTQFNCAAIDAVHDCTRSQAMAARDRVPCSTAYIDVGATARSIVPECLFTIVAKRRLPL